MSSLKFTVKVTLGNETKGSTMNLNANDMSLAVLHHRDLLREAEQRQLVREARRKAKADDGKAQAGQQPETVAVQMRLQSAT